MATSYISSRATTGWQRRRTHGPPRRWIAEATLYALIVGACWNSLKRNAKHPFDWKEVWTYSLSIEIAYRQKVKLIEKRKSVHHLQMHLQRRPTVAVQGSCHTQLHLWHQKPCRCAKRSYFFKLFKKNGEYFAFAIWKPERSLWQTVWRISVSVLIFLQLLRIPLMYILFYKDRRVVTLYQWANHPNP